MKKMMRKVSIVICASLVIGMSIVGTASAGGCNDTQNMYTEGIDLPCNETNAEVTIMTSALGCPEDMQTEGPGTKCVSSLTMINPKPDTVAVYDTWTEGPSNSTNTQESVANYKHAALEAKPALGTIK